MEKNNSENNEMSSREKDKLITEQFMENARTNDEIVGDIKSESEKMILEEISTEKNTDVLNDNMVNSSLLKSINSEVDSDETNEDVKSGDFYKVTAEDIKTTDDSYNEKNGLNQIDSKIQTSINDGDVECHLNSKNEPVEKPEWEDILGSGVILKKILQEGEADTRPKRSERCFIKYTCKVEGSDSDVIVDQAEYFEMCLGEADVIQGLDVAVGLMNKKEHSLLKVQARLAFGDRGLMPLIPPKATVIYDIQLVDVKEEADFDSLSIQDRRKIGNKKRERGNWWYQRNENTLAVQCYRRALDFLDEVENERETYKPTDGELQELLEDRLKVLNNMASAQIKMELYDQALTSLQTVLRCQPENIKALYRKAKVHISKNDLSQALQLLEKAKSVDPEDATITKEINNVNLLIQKQKNSEREYARRMFGGSGVVNQPKKKPSEKEDGKNRSKFHLWTSLGATVVLGVAGLIAYKMKYA
ncbi:peptidyl-prolyl cis-trans isomerase FKBP8-like [Rhynchophorus ferrugineus]